MATTVQHAVRPLLRIVSALGLGVYSQEKVYLSVTYNVSIWICYAYLYYYSVTAFKAETMFLQRNDVIATVCSVVSCVSSIILSAFYNKKFWIFMKKLDAVDHTLTELGTLKMYHKLQTYIKITISACFMCGIVATALDMKWWYDATSNHWTMIIPFISNYLYVVTVVVNVVFWTFLWYIGTRFEKLNEQMRCFLIKEEHVLRCTWRRSVSVYRRCMMRTDNYKPIFWILMHLHLELCRISHELNAMFGVQITLEIMGSMMMLTQIYARTVSWSTNRCTITFIALQYWMLLYIGRLFYLSYLCETVSAKAKKIKIVHQLTHFLRYADIRNEIHQFTLQVIHHPLKFTGAGLFEFGYSILRHLVLTVVTFVILRVQK